MYALGLLKKQHRKAEPALKLVRGYDEETLHQVASELAAHMVVEETIFYPAVQRVKPELVLESFEARVTANLRCRDDDGHLLVVVEAPRNSLVNVKYSFDWPAWEGSKAARDAIDHAARKRERGSR